MSQPDDVFDPEPEAPEPPADGACCGSGCDPCIFDAHDMAMDEYRQALRAWRERQTASERSLGADGPASTGA